MITLMIDSLLLGNGCNNFAISASDILIVVPMLMISAPYMTLEEEKVMLLRFGGVGFLEGNSLICLGLPK